MALETPVVHIADLVPANPASADPKSQGDDHIRNIKTALRNDLAGYTGAVSVTGADGGAVNAYTLTPASGLVAYGLRMAAIFSPVATNTGAATLDISGLGAKPIRSISGADLVAGDVAAGSIYIALYSGAEFRLIAPTKQYIDQLAFLAALPAQAGNDDRHITTVAGVASWTDLLIAQVMKFADSVDRTKRLQFDLSSLTAVTTRTVAWPDKSGTAALTSDVGMPPPLAVITPTAVAAIDLPSVFSAAYDYYAVEVEGIAPATLGQSLMIRLANGGAVDTGSNYVTAPVGSSSSTTATSITTQGVGPAGGSISGSLQVRNCNDAANLKAVRFSGVSAPAGAGAYGSFDTQYAYIGGAVSGLRLYWSGGSNFAAQGKIRVYGFRN